MVSIFTGLYELFEEDSFSDLLALRNTAKRISGNKDILINFNQDSTIAFTDGNFIYLPRRFNNDIKSARGLVAHESGHIGYGSYEISFMKLVKTITTKYKLPSILVKKLINVVEDVRINALNDIKFPGFYQDLRKLTTKLLPRLKLRMKKSGDILIYINLFMEDYEEFQKKPQFRTKIMSDKDWKAISIAKTFLLKTLTPTSSIITIDQLSKVLKKYYIKKTIKKIPPQTHSSSQAAYRELINEEDFDIGESFSDMAEFSPKDDYESDFNEDIDSDFMEDPCYYDESEYQNHRDFNQGRREPLINHFDEFSDKQEIFEKTELNCVSEEIIEKIKDSNLSTDDIERLIEGVTSIKGEQDKIYNSDVQQEFEKINNEIDISSEVIDEFVKKELNNRAEINGIEEAELNNLKELSPDTSNELEFIREGTEKEDYISEFIKLVNDAHNVMEDRLFILERGASFQRLSGGKGERQVKEALIENEVMKPIQQSYSQIKGTYNRLITRIRFIFKDFRNQIDIDNFQKRGRLNSKFIKAVTSEYKYNKCFSRKIKQKELKILLLVDISGSMGGSKLHAAKIAMIMLSEALYKIAQLRIVLFTGDYDAINILLKDFNEKPDPKKFDNFGCHGSVCSNLDGISIKHEAAKLEKNVLIIVISDGQPAGSGNYGLNDAIKEIHDVKKIFKVFAFSIDAKGDYLDKLYDKNWILTNSSDKTDLGDKLIKFCRLVVKEFFR